MEEITKEKKIGKLKKKLIFVVVVTLVVLLAAGFMWYQGRVQGKESAASEIADMEAEIAKLKEEVEKWKNMPAPVNPVAPEITLDVVNQEIKSIGELATMECFYTNAAKYSDAKHIKKWSVPFTGKSFIMKWDGVIKAGIEVDEVATEIDTEKKIVTVYLPQAKILSHDPDKDSAEVLDEKDGLFNPVTVDDQVKFDAAVEKEMEEQAIERGLLEKAQKNAEEIIEKLLLAIPGAEEYTIEFKVLEA